MEDLQKEIQEAIEKSLQGRLEENLNKPIYEFVGTYDAGRFTKYIGS
ncbi:MAG: hypothetical protein HFJ55_05090 [Clostridia bacterium]|jgi:hypothetical protein|nr:hypothetical protein [Clostridia bacterium]